MTCIFEVLLPCYCYATKARSRTIHSGVLQTVNLLLLLCSVSVISANKLSLQELTQLIRIELLILLVSPNFQGGQMPVFPPPCGRPWLQLLH